MRYIVLFISILLSQSISACTSCDESEPKITGIPDTQMFEMAGVDARGLEVDVDLSISDEGKVISVKIVKSTRSDINARLIKRIVMQSRFFPKVDSSCRRLATNSLLYKFMF